jgi:hypothetical protein
VWTAVSACRSAAREGFSKYLKKIKMSNFKIQISNECQVRCHSRENGNPGCRRKKLDSCLRRKDGPKSENG